MDLMMIIDVFDCKQIRGAITINQYSYFVIRQWLAVEQNEKSANRSSLWPLCFFFSLSFLHFELFFTFFSLHQQETT